MSKIKNIVNIVKGSTRFLEFVDMAKNIRMREYFYFGLIGLLGLLLLISSMTNNNLSANKVVRITIPPNLEFGQIISSADIDYQQIYQLAGQVMQNIYHWQNSGKEDFKQNINKLTALITPEYKQYLLEEYSKLNRQNKLDKTRALIPLVPISEYKDDFVTPIENNTAFVVLIDFKLQTHQENYLIIDAKLRYTVRVVIRDVNPDYNPWGWQLDVPPVKPIRIK